VLEIVPCEAVIVACHARPEALDELPNGLGLILRIARDESWVVAAATRRSGLLTSARLWLESADPEGITIDQTDGWAVYAVRGEGAIEVLGRISVAPVPSQRPAFIQGALSGVPGKVVITVDGLHLFVPSPVGHHLEARLLETCADLRAKLAPSAPLGLGSIAMVEAAR
jgi:hypothetical protein